jgi:glutathione S-transferase
MSITLFGAPYTSASRVHWALEELKISYEKSLVDLSKGQHKSEEFLKINPNGVVPALVDDGLTLFESVAIIVHLGEKYGVEKGLWFASKTPEHSLAMQWTIWSGVTLGGALSRFIQNTSERVAAEARNAQSAELGRASMHQALKVLDGQLSGKQFILGERFTLLDVIVGSVVGYAAMVGIELSQHAHVAAWVARINDRPARAVSLAPKWD